MPVTRVIVELDGGLVKIYKLNGAFLTIDKDGEVVGLNDGGGYSAQEPQESRFLNTNWLGTPHRNRVVDECIGVVKWEQGVQTKAAELAAGTAGEVADGMARGVARKARWLCECKAAALGKVVKRLEELKRKGPVA